MRSIKKCRQCQEQMQERTFHRPIDLLLYCLLYAGVAAGALIAFQLPDIGWIIGPAVIIVALWCGLRVRGAWVCGKCGNTEVFQHFGQE